ncbi:MAG: cache domain-containing protein [Potamolinea sp.]
MDIYPVNRLIARVAGKVSLRGVLIIPFVLQIVGTVGLVGYLSFKSGQKAVNDLGHQLINEVGDRVEHYLKTYLSTPQLINRINVDAIREGTINLQDLPKLERHMFVQLLQFNSVTSLVIGNERGDFRAYSNSLRLHLLRSDPSNTSQIYDYTLDSNGKIISLFRTFQQPDVRQRPWYRVAQEARKPVWSPIFQLGDHTDFAINFSHPIYDQTTNKFLGVVSVNLGISNVGEFLNTFKVGNTGEVFIIERPGLLVAASTNEPLYITNKQQQLERLDIANSSHTLTRSTGEFLRKKLATSRLSRTNKNLNSSKMANVNLCKSYHLEMSLV